MFQLMFSKSYLHHRLEHILICPIVCFHGPQVMFVVDFLSYAGWVHQLWPIRLQHILGHLSVISLELEG